MPLEQRSLAGAWNMGPRRSPTGAACPGALPQPDLQHSWPDVPPKDHVGSSSGSGGLLNSDNRKWTDTDGVQDTPQELDWAFPNGRRHKRLWKSQGSIRDSKEANEAWQLNPIWIRDTWLGPGLKTPPALRKIIEVTGAWALAHGLGTISSYQGYSFLGF